MIWKTWDMPIRASSTPGTRETLTTQRFAFKGFGGIICEFWSSLGTRILPSLSVDGVKIDPTEVLGSYACPAVERMSLLDTSGMQM